MRPIATFFTKMVSPDWRKSNRIQCVRLQSLLIRIIRLVSIIQSSLTVHLRRLWQFAGLILFEPPSCLLCQVLLDTEQHDIEPLDANQFGATQPGTRQLDIKQLDVKQLGAKPIDLEPLALNHPDLASNLSGQAGAPQQFAPAARGNFSLLTRVKKMRTLAQKSLCTDCVIFFSELAEVKTTLIGDDDESAITCFSSGFYSGLLQEAIYQIKYLKRRDLAQALAFSLLPPTTALLQTVTINKISGRHQQGTTIVLPVPLHKTKLKERGFNQAEELAISVAALLNLKVDNQSLKRVRPTRPQFGLSRRQRRLNLKGAFAGSKSLAGKNVILVDDVLTSGATLYECAMAVATAGGNVLGAVTLARAKWQKRSQQEESTLVPPISLVF